MLDKSELCKLVNKHNMETRYETTRGVAEYATVNSYGGMYKDLVSDLDSQRDFFEGLLDGANPINILSSAAWCIAISLYKEADKPTERFIKWLVKEVDWYIKVYYTNTINGKIVVDTSRSATAKEFLKAVVEYIADCYEKEIIRLINEDE